MSPNDRLDRVPAAHVPVPDVAPPANAPQEWSLVIRPEAGWFDLHLGDLWRYRDLTMLFAWRDFVATYKQTILGPLWYGIQPVFTTILFTVVFGRVAGIPTDGIPPSLFYMAGITTFTYFSDCLTRTSSTFITNASIFGKVYFPRLCVPISVVISNLARFGTQLVIFLGFLGYYLLRHADIHPNAWVLVTPFLVLLLAFLGLGLGIIVSALTVKYRDLQQVVTFGAPLLMYASPVIFPISKVPERYRDFMLLNPLTSILEVFRYAFLGKSTLGPSSLLVATAITFGILACGILLFTRVERTFTDSV